MGGERFDSLSDICAGEIFAGGIFDQLNDVLTGEIFASEKFDLLSDLCRKSFGGEIFNLLKDIRTGGHREVVRDDGNELKLSKVIEGGMSLKRFIVGCTCMTLSLLTSEVEQTCLDYS